MEYAFSVGFDILNFSTYGDLTSVERAEARSGLFALVQGIFSRMGVFDVDDPAVKLAAILTAASVAPNAFTIGWPLQRGYIYRTDPRTGVMVCIWIGELANNGMPFHGQVDVGGTQITASFRVSYEANNEAFGL